MKIIFKGMLVLLITLGIADIAVAQTTPNIGLNIPAHGTPNWDVLMNANSSLLDLLLSGNLAIPALEIGGSPPARIQIPAGTFATLTGTVTCNSGNEGTIASVTDSTTNTWGATITGTGSLHVGAYCDGTDWTVYAK